MKKVFFDWGRRLLLRASLIQILAVGLVALLDGAERATVGGWAGWLPELFVLHLHGLGFYFVLATLWLDRDWRIGGERQALAVAGRSGRELVLLTVLLGGLWSTLWGGAGLFVQSATIEHAPHWIQPGGAVRADFHGGEAAALSDLSIRLEGSKVVEIRTIEPGQVTQRWSDNLSGRWAGKTDSVEDGFRVAPQVDREGLLLAFVVLLGQGIIVGVAGGLSLWAGARYSWLAALGIALVGLLAMGINSAVLRGYWEPGALLLLPLFAVLLLALSWPRGLKLV